MAINVNGINLSSSAGTTLSIDSGATNWMSVNSNGIINRLQKPYMRGQLVSKGVFYYTNSANITVIGVDENVGNCWNNTTGNFTCPIAGYYMVTMGGIAAGGGHGRGTYGYPNIRKNGGWNHFTHWSHASYWEYVNLSGILNCAVGDTISFGIQAGNGSDATNGWYGEGGHGCFSIGLI